MELSTNTKNALVQLLAIRINNKLQKGLQQQAGQDEPNITHTNKDRTYGTYPANWNAAFLAYPKQLYTAITGSASAANGNLVIQIWLGYDVKPSDGSTTPSTSTESRIASSIQFEDMEAGVDDTGSNGPYPVVFKSGTTPPVEYFAVEPGGPRPTYEDNKYQEPKYPVYDGTIAAPFPVGEAGALVT